MSTSDPEESRISGPLTVAVVGATGAVGREMLSVLEERGFPLTDIRLLASARSAGARLTFQGAERPVEELTHESFRGVDIALFSAGAGVSREYAPAAVESGARVIDNSSAFRMDADVPLVVPEVNPEAVGTSRIIANPNCSTIQLVVVLKPLHDLSPVRRVVVSTYQAVSGAGHKAVEELKAQSRALVEGEDPEPKVLPRRIGWNVVPQIDVFEPSGFTREEMKMVHETRKIMGDQSIAVTATTVRVPVVRGHSESVYIETEERIGAERAREVLAGAPGIRVMDDPSRGEYPTALEAAGRDECFVGRIRDDLSVERGLNLWIVADNLRKGAALNAVQIAELLLPVVAEERRNPVPAAGRLA